MKIRSDFVTNSSSSSYVISVDPGAFGLDKETLIKSIDVGIHLFGAWGVQVISSEVDLNRYAVDHYCYGNKTLPEVLEKNPHSRKIYEKSLEAISQGKIVVMQRVEDGDCDRAGSFRYSQGQGLLEIIDSN